VSYLELRVCERLGMRRAEFRTMRYEEQISLLAYERLRQEEEAAIRGVTG